MNRMALIGLLLAGGTIAVDHLICALPAPLAVAAYGAGIVLILLGMSKSRKTRS